MVHSTQIFVENINKKFQKGTSYRNIFNLYVFSVRCTSQRIDYCFYKYPAALPLRLFTPKPSAKNATNFHEKPFQYLAENNLF